MFACGLPLGRHLLITICVVTQHLHCYHSTEGIRLSRPRHCSKCAVHAQAVYCSNFREKHKKNCLQRWFNLGTSRAAVSFVVRVTYVVACSLTWVIASNICRSAWTTRARSTRSTAPNSLPTKVTTCLRHLPYNVFKVLNYLSFCLEILEWLKHQIRLIAWDMFYVWMTTRLQKKWVLEHFSLE